MASRGVQRPGSLAAGGAMAGAAVAAGVISSPPTAPSTELPAMPESALEAALLGYRSGGLGVYAVVIRFVTMPLEKIAMIMNSSQVSGSGQLSQAYRLAFSNGPLTPFRTVGSASIVAWFFQYSVMGFVFQLCDRALSKALDAPTIPYGPDLMKPRASYHPELLSTSAASPAASAKFAGKAVLAPIMAGCIESVVANRAEAQRFYGPDKLAKIEQKLGWSALRRQLGPGFLANASRNTVMSATSFVVTPTLYKAYFPQEKKSQSSLFWFGLGVNIFFGNVIAITQQSLWGRALDAAAHDGGRHINYRQVITQSLKVEGASAFFTPPKWATRVLMNAPIQGTVPWFYNEILPLGEGAAMSLVSGLYGTVLGRL